MASSKGKHKANVPDQLLLGGLEAAVEVLTGLLLVNDAGGTDKLVDGTEGPTRTTLTLEVI